MEPFFDGGLFEVLFAIGIGYFLNFIFQRKLLLIIYTGVSIMAPVLLLFVKTGEIYYWAVGITIFNTILLVVLFWKQKITEPGKPLFDTEKYLSDFLETVKTLRKNFIQKRQKVYK
jgi:hypothetical protein